MGNEWHWALADDSGARAGDLDAPHFPTQAEAESWLGEEWPVLLDGGIVAASLYQGEVLVYGPMSLRPQA
ncbi:MAG: hypothetical protein V9G08_10220 [Dermatophilaceae bacterium]